MHAGLRASGPKADLALVVADAPAAAAGVFTKNVMAAAPVGFCKAALAASPTTRAVLVNAGQANAATGAAGEADCVASADALAAAAGLDPGDVLLLSTGVIGRRIKMEPLLSALPTLVSGLGASPADAHHAAVAITTTDTVSKAAALEVVLEGGGGGGSSPVTVRVGGMAKGSGMIHPDMATMLAVLTTDAAVEPALWRRIVSDAAAASFNQITVDGDTSTNDTVVGLASGAAPGAVLLKSESDPGAATLAAAVTALLQGLAKAIAWDGEGATCLVEVRVTGAGDDAGARKIAKSVVGSSLVKAAIFGGDPNWGRIACAAGYAGVAFAPGALDITLGPVALMKAGQPLAFDEKAASAYLKSTAAQHGTVGIDVCVGGGPGAGVAWGCDLSYDYVSINAEYTT
jgi:glutamate N-acetyltransferase / amino-acid N-acetyltransferase